MLASYTASYRFDAETPPWSRSAVRGDCDQYVRFDLDSVRYSHADLFPFIFSWEVKVSTLDADVALVGFVVRVVSYSPGL